VAETHADAEEYVKDENATFIKKRKKSKDRIVKKVSQQKSSVNLSKILDEMQDSADLPLVNFFSISAAASNLPARKFCSVCGLLSAYHCTRCGMKFCSVKCNEMHKDTRCLKFAL